MNSFSLKTKYSIKIPKNITTLYCKKTNLITFIGPLKKKSLTVKVNIIFLTFSNTLIVTSLPINKTSNVGKEKAKYMQGTTLSQIKHILVEINYKLYKKLILVGVGYRAFPFELVKNQIFLKLGFSHLVYFKIPNKFKTFNVKSTKLFLFGNSSLNDITKLASLIRQCKKPEPYKGKGILYYNEKLTLKKGKKI